MGRTLPAAVAAVAALALLLPLPRTAPAAPGPAKSVTLRDPQAQDPVLMPSDCLALSATSDRDGLHLSVTLGADLAKGMFTCVHVYVDADNNEETGIGGSELWYRASVGSRFRPNDAKPRAPGERAPLEERRLSHSSVTAQESLDGGEPTRTWLNQPLPGEPRVDGATIAFDLPAGHFARGTEWSSPEVAFRVVVESWCGDQPLVVDHVAADEGLPIVVDGDDGDWSGCAADFDAGDELPPALRHLDLVRLRVDHEGKRLLVSVDAQVPGFAAPYPSTKDVARTESITLLAEPADAEYDAPRRLVITRPKPKGSGPDGEWMVFGRTIEVALPRTGLEGRTRVLAWSESSRRDTVPDTGRARVARPGR